MTTSSHCNTGRTCLPLHITTRENTCSENRDNTCTENWKTRGTSAILRRIELEGWLSPTERASAG